MAPVTIDHYESSRDFHIRRLELIEQGRTPVPLVETPKTVLHVIPASVANPLFHADLELVRTLGLMPPNATATVRTRYSIDGLARYCVGTGTPRSYAMVLRVGAVEMVACEEADPDGFYRPWKTELVIAKRLGDYIRLLRQLRATTPLCIWMTLTGMAGQQMRVPPAVQALEHRDNTDCPLPYAEARLSLPMTALDYFDVKFEPTTMLRAAFDALWQAFGYSRSHCFDVHGKWSECSFEG